MNIKFQIGLLTISKFFVLDSFPVKETHCMMLLGNDFMYGRVEFNQMLKKAFITPGNVREVISIEYPMQQTECRLRQQRIISG